MNKSMEGVVFMDKMESNNDFKRLLGVFLVLAMLLVIQINVVSAFDFDNVKDDLIYSKDTKLIIGDKTIDYNPIWEKYKPVEITNTFGLGKTLFKGAIDEHTEVCGTGCFSTINIYLENAGTLFDSIEYYKITNNGGKVKTNIKQENFSYIKNSIEYDYNAGDIVSGGNYLLKIEGSKHPKDTIDWVLETNGKTISEWAYWGGYDFSDYDYLLLENNLTISSGTTILGGTLKYNEVLVTGTGKIEINSTIGWLNITAYNVTIESSIDGDAKSNNTGSTPGGAGGAYTTANTAVAGTNGAISGSTGGGGGAGGKCVESDNPTGGTAGIKLALVATETGINEEEISGVGGGSGAGGGGGCADSGAGNGASGSSGIGASGGATIKINSGLIYINGTISMNGGTGGAGGTGGSAGGSTGASGAGGGGGAGGAGGQIILQGMNINITNSKLYTTGGGGGTGGAGGGSAPYGEGGVGASGQAGNNGRIKVFYGIFDNASSTLTSSTTYYNNFSSVGIITQTTPSNDFYSNKNAQELNCSAIINSGTSTLVNMSILTNESGSLIIVNSTDVTGTSNASALYTTLENSENYLWQCQACDSDGECGTTSSRTLTIDQEIPIISTGNLTSFSTFIMPINSSWNITTTDLTLDSCWYNSTDHATTFETCNANIQTEWTTGGTKSVTFCANDSVNNIDCLTEEIIITYFNVTATDSQDPIGEGGSVVFTLNLEGTGISSKYANSNASFTFNSVAYTTDTKSLTDPDKIVITKTLSIPSGSGNETGKLLDWNFDWDIRNTTASRGSSSSASNITVYNMSISDSCAGKYIFLNWTLRDEEFQTLVNVTSPNIANVEFDIDVTSKTDSSITWEYSKTWTDTQSAVLCVDNSLLNNTEYRIDWVAEYSGTDNVLEFHYLDNGTLDKSGEFNSLTTNVTRLSDLATADSTTFLFDYTDEDGLTVSNSIVHTFRKYIGEGIFREVERSKADNNGQTHIHLVEEDVIYYFVISDDGEILFTSDEYNAKCLSTICSLSLTGSPTTTNWTYYDRDGWRYSISSDRDTRIATLTFNLESSATMNASLYEFVDRESTLIASDTLTATAGTINLPIPIVYGNSTFYMAVYKDDEFIESSWVDMTESGKEYFGTFGALLGGLIVLAIILMAISEGVGIIIFGALALVIIAVMELVDLSWLALVSIIGAGAIIIFKITTRSRRQS